MKHTARCLLLGAALLASLPALAQYSWIDGEGHRVFSDQPPPSGIPQKNILSEPATPPVAEPSPAAAVNKPAASGQDKTLEEKKKAADAAATAQTRAEEQKHVMERADNCQRAKLALAGLQSGARIAQFDAQGHRFYMTDDQRAAEIKRVQGITQSDCP